MSGVTDIATLTAADQQVDLETGADDYIGKIGERIKSIRMRRGMTRRTLSNHSRISERYLSQVESGRANISVALLWRISHAMDVAMRDLLPDQADCVALPGTLRALLQQCNASELERVVSVLKATLPEHERKIQGVALVGLRGAGKSALGRALSRLTQVPYVDLVDEVRSISGMAVDELFSLGGQKAYRRFERQALDNVLASNPMVIVETGGSLVTQADTYAKLMNHFFTVWIKAAPEEHMARVVAQGDLRPMHGAGDAMEDLKRILRERESEYRCAHYVLNTSGRTVNACVNELKHQTREVLNQGNGTVDGAMRSSTQ